MAKACIDPELREIEAFGMRLMMARTPKRVIRVKREAE